jgi:hypothetical protein
MFEYACHEGNTAVRNYIETARYAKAHPKPPAPAGAAPAGGGGRGGREAAVAEQRRLQLRDDASASLINSSIGDKEEFRI